VPFDDRQIVRHGGAGPPGWRHVAWRLEATLRAAAVTNSPWVERVAEFREKLLARGNPKRGKPADKAFYDD
jgi:hypothetical protein